VDFDASSLDAELRFEQPAHHIVLEDCIAAVEAATARRDRLEAHIEAALPDWSLTPVVRALQALRGMALVAAATLVAELGDITRFAIPASSWRISVWFRPSTPAAPHAAKAESRKLGMARRSEC
jgi:transposase